MVGLTIGKVAAEAGVKVDTLRYYEREGVIAQARRSGTNYRLYPEETIRRVQFVKRAQELGFSLAEIKELLALGTANCGRVREQMVAKVTALDEKIRLLQRMRRTLVRWAKECPDDAVGVACPILHGLVK